MTTVPATAAAAAPAPELVLTATGVRRRFGAVTALEGFALAVRPGELVGLVGPDGAGKTTAMRILAGVIGADGGEVQVLGHRPLSSAPALRTALGYMPQQYSLYGDLTIEENLRFFSRLFCLSRAEYRERRGRLLAITRLERFADRRADALSGGMYKKLALACVLLPRPRLLLMDEPTNGVDPVSRRELWALLFELVAAGMAIVVSTPYMDEAARCHRVALIDHGRVILEGAPSQLLDDFRGVVLLVSGGERDALERSLVAHPAVIAVAVAGEGLRVVGRPGSELALRAALAAAGAEAHVARADFEDLFLSVTAAPLAAGGQTVGVSRQAPPAPRTAEARMVIRTAQLTRRFGAFVAVREVTFAVARGEIFGYLGANGAGKSTTIRMLCGLLPPSSGEAWINDVSVAAEPERVKQQLGYMSQRFSLYPDLLVFENLEFFGGAYGLSGRGLRVRIDQALERVGLAAERTTRTGDLPGGQRQRVALASALLHGPEILFLDEPTAGVDPAARRAFWRLIRELAAGGTTLFVTTHYMDEAEYCHRIGLMVDGRLVALDRPARLKEQHVPGLLLKLEGMEVARALALARDLPGVLAAQPFGAAGHLRLDPARLDEAGLRSSLVAAGLGALRLEAIAPTLEDVFLAVVEAR